MFMFHITPICAYLCGTLQNPIKRSFKNASLSLLRKLLNILREHWEVPEVRIVLDYLLRTWLWWMLTFIWANRPLLLMKKNNKNPLSLYIPDTSIGGWIKWIVKLLKYSLFLIGMKRINLKSQSVSLTYQDVEIDVCHKLRRDDRQRFLIVKYISIVLV